MNDEPHTLSAPGRLRVSIFILLMVVLVAIAIVGVAVSGGGEPVQRVVPRVDIPAYHVIGPGDVTTRAVSGEGDFERPVTLFGRLTLEPLATGEPIAADAVTPQVVGEVGPVRLELTPENASALALQPGDRVVLDLSPTSTGVRPAEIPAILAGVPDIEDNARQAYIVALKRCNARRLLRVLGRSRLLIRRPTS